MAKDNLIDRPLPSSPEMEEAIISAIIHNDELLTQATSLLEPECFYNKANSDIFQSMINMNEHDKPIDMITLSNEVKDIKSVSDLGGPYYIAVLATKYDSISNFNFYIHVVFELFVRREMIILFQNKIQELYNTELDILDIYDAVYKRLEEIFGKVNDDQIKTMKSSIDKTLDEITSISKGEVLPYIKTGVDLIDNHIYFTNKFILGIASSRGSGKTRYLIHLVKNMLKSNNKDDIAILWYSMEDSDSKIIRLFVAPDVGLTDAQMQSKNHTLSQKEIDKIFTEINKFSEYNVEFVNNQESMARISRNFNRFIKKHSDKQCILIIDNIMLVEDLYNSDSKNQTAIEDSIAASLRRIVNKAEKNGNKASIIFLHHMTKAMESFSNAEEAYRPKLAHMKGTTRFADVCNAIILLNNTGAHKDLIKRHSQLPDIKCINSDGSIGLYKRTAILQNLLIAEVAKNRDGEMADDNKAIERYLTDFGTMKFNVLKTTK